MQTDATTPNSVAQTMLGVVAFVVCKRMQQLPTSLGPAVHRGKDTTHKSLWSMRNERALPQQCWKSCANGSNIVAPRFGDHGTKEMLGVIGWKVWPVSNSAQQHATTSNNMQQGEQTDATCNIQQCWELLVNNVAFVCMQPQSAIFYSFHRLGHKSRISQFGATVAWSIAVRRDLPNEKQPP